MKIQSVKKSKSNYFFLLVIFLFIGSFSNLFSQIKDTLWTRNLQPYYIINGVFSPDDQYIYVTTTSPYYVLKYDLQGNLLEEIKDIGGIRQFSEDGRFFWNYYGDKYDANTFQRLSVLFTPWNLLFEWPKPDYWNVSINEKMNIGIATTWHGVTKSTQSSINFDSNLVFFNPSNSKVIGIGSYENKRFRYLASDIHPNGEEVSYIVASVVIEENQSYFDTIRIEIWNIIEKRKLKEIKISNPSSWDKLKLKYSPDGSVLGYQHDGKLTLYSTTDYSVVWESENFGIYNFSWSNDMSILYLSTGILGMNKLKYSDKSLIHNYLWVVSSKFIEFDRLNRYILVGNGSFGLLDNSITSIKDDFFDKIKINLIQNQSTNEFSFKINSPEPAVGNYTISNMLGEIMQYPIQINISEGTNQFELKTADFPTGIYFLTLTLSGKTQTLKFGVVR